MMQAAMTLPPTLPPMMTSTDQGVDIPRGSRGALGNGMSVHVSAIEVDSPPGRYSCDSSGADAAGLHQSDRVHD
jgi:hypothetical protein